MSPLPREPFLAIDCSQRREILVAYYSEGLKYEERLSGDSSLEELLTIAWLDDLNQLLPTQGKICINLGPGSFTGLRVGLSFALGVASALPSIQLVGYSGFFLALKALQLAGKQLSEKNIVCMHVGGGRVAWDEISLSELQGNISCSERDWMQEDSIDNFLQALKIHSHLYVIADEQRQTEFSEKLSNLADIQVITLPQTSLDVFANMTDGSAVYTGLASCEWRSKLLYGRSFVARNQSGESVSLLQ